MVKATASAPGKVILFGEHAVVYGVTAVSASLSDLRIFADTQCVQRGEPMLEIVLHDLQIPAVMDEDKDKTKDRALEDIVPAPVHVALSRLSPMFSLLDGVRESSDDPNTARSPSDSVMEGLRSAFPVPSFCSSSQEQQCIMAVSYLICRLFPEYVRSGKLSGEGGKGTFNSLKLEIKSVGLPIGAGLGSSAAFSVALAGALIRLRHKLYRDIRCLLETGAGMESEGGIAPVDDSKWPGSVFDASNTFLSSSAFLRPTSSSSPPLAIFPLINAWAYASEVVIHGSPSGLDNTTCCYGGALKYVRTTGEFSQIGTLPEVKILLTNTRVPRSTKILVAGVRTLYEAVPTVVKPIFDSIEAISHGFLQVVADAQAEAAAGKRDKDKVLDEMAIFMHVNQCLLNAIGVGHPSLDQVVLQSKQCGYASKLTGAGGGGCAITLLDDRVSEDGSNSDNGSNKQKLCAGLAELGFETFESAIAGEGVRWHR